MNESRNQKRFRLAQNQASLTEEVGAVIHFSILAAKFRELCDKEKESFIQ